MADSSTKRLALLAKLKWTLRLEVVYAALAAGGDWLVNGVLLGQPEAVTPWADALIAVAIGGPATFYLLSQRFDLRRALGARAELEEELVRAVSQAETAARAKADFLANMTHELRTPLNAIVGFAVLLKSSRQLTSQDAHQVELIYEAGLNLLGLVNDVLDFSKLESSPIHFEARPFQPGELALSCVRLLSTQAKAKGLDLAVAAPGPLEPLYGDAMRLRQVLLNFLSNAVKFTEAGRIEVRMDLRPSGEDRILRVEVRDTGIGVPRERLDTIFERFTQADPAVARRFGGTGLGLAISKTLVEGMGGRIGVESTPGRGSTFWFEVPARLAPAAAPEAPEAAPAAPRGGARVLVVDDNAVNRELIAAILKPTDLDLEFAVNGAEAVDAVARAPFDLILMDVQMPVMDGLTATRRIRAAEAGREGRTPIIAMTANVLAEQVQTCLNAGMDDHVGKPFQPRTLLEAIDRCLRPDAAEPAGGRAAAG